MKPNSSEINRQTLALPARLGLLARYTTAAVGLCSIMLLGSQSFAAEAKELNRADTRFVEQEAAVSMNAIRLGELAVEKTSNAEVKEIAEEVVTHQKVANQEITTFASARNVKLSEVKPDENTRTYSVIEATSKEDFDRAYLSEVVAQNKRCIRDFEKLSANKDTDPDLKAWADKMLPTANAMLTKAEELHTKLMAETASVSTSM
jgi:putative membrane protein